jgi:hypothetical protein
MALCLNFNYGREEKKRKTKKSFCSSTRNLENSRWNWIERRIGNKIDSYRRKESKVWWMGC